MTAAVVFLVSSVSAWLICPPMALIGVAMSMPLAYPSSFCSAGSVITFWRMTGSERMAPSLSLRSFWRMVPALVSSVVASSLISCRSLLAYI